MSVAKHQAMLHNKTARAKSGDVQSFCCNAWAYSLPAAHSQRQQNMR